MSQNETRRAYQTSNINQKSQNQPQQYQQDSRIPPRSNYTTYEIRSNHSSMAQVPSTRVSAYNATRDLNRQSAAVNTAVKNQFSGPAPIRQRVYYTNTNANTNSSNTNRYQIQNQNQNRSSNMEGGRTYEYQQTSRREYLPNGTSIREAHRGASMGVETHQNSRMTYHTQYAEDQSIRGMNERYRNNIYVSGSGSPGQRRYMRNMENESSSNSYIRGGVVRLRNWKYTTQTEINKIILIQRFWRYVCLRRIERRQTMMSQSSEKKSENELSSSGEQYEENGRYRNLNLNNLNYTNLNENENIFRTETKVRKNAREKIISGTKNRYIVETTTIEVFKNQNTVLKKVEPEKLIKTTKKIKRRGIKEQMIEIWSNEINITNNDSISLSCENIPNQYTQTIEEYEEQIKQISSKIVQYVEDALHLYLMTYS